MKVQPQVAIAAFFICIFFISLVLLSLAYRKTEVRTQIEGCPIFRNLSSSSVHISWLPPPNEESFDFFELYIQEKSENLGEEKKIYSGNGLSYSAADLQPLSTYVFTVKSLNINNQVKSTCSRFIRIPGVLNLVANPSFELEGPPRIPQVDYGKRNFSLYWEPIMMPYEVDKTTSHTGTKSIKISSSNIRNKFGASHFIFLNQTEPEPLMLSAWSKAEAVSGQTDDGYGVLMDVKYADGTYGYALSLNFAPGSHDWERRCLILDKSEQRIVYVNIFLVFSGHSGAAWFDDVILTSKISEESKEGCNVVEVTPVLPTCCATRKTIPAEKSPSYHDVSIVTQLTVDRLPILRKMVENWSGPISAAVYVLDKQNDQQQVEEMRNISIDVRQRVDFHMVDGEEGRFAFRTLGLYPVNTLRNEAISKCRTSHALVLDVDFVTNPTAYEAIRESFSFLDQQTRTVFVVPAFELDDFSKGLPQSKVDLIKLVNENKARQVHKTKWDPAHGPCNYTQWYKTQENYEISYQKDFEPYVLGRTDMPRWDERFIGYGYDKVSHTTELNQASYRFIVMAQAFIIHWDHGVPSWRDKGDLVRVRVWQNYYNFLEEIEIKYKTYLPAEQGLRSGKFIQKQTHFPVFILLFLGFAIVVVVWLFKNKHVLVRTFFKEKS